MIDRSVQYTKGKSALEFSLLKSCLCWLFCPWLSPWRKASQSGKMHCPISLITLIQPTCSGDCGSTGDRVGSIRIPFPQFQPHKRILKLSCEQRLFLSPFVRPTSRLKPSLPHVCTCSGHCQSSGLMEGGHQVEDPTSFLQGFGRNWMNLVLREPMYLLNYLLEPGLVDPMFLKWGHTKQGWPVMRSSQIGVKKVSSSVAKLILRK